ncbi:hypothetical protein AKJ13_27905 [Methylobacterium sp. ARG-1]|nr:hypothetical protein AKJ13_27905 [Methylobacterium sp. ARG-1]
MHLAAHREPVRPFYEISDDMIIYSQNEYRESTVLKSVICIILFHFHDKILIIKFIDEFCADST